MKYTSTSEFESEFGSDDMPEDVAKLDRALERASRLIDTFCRSAGLAVPLSDAAVISEIKGQCLDLARYFTWNDNASEEIRARYEDAIKFLEGVSTGKVRLTSSTSSPTGGGIRSVRLIRG